MSSELPAAKYVVGTGPLLQAALAAWAEVAPDTRLHPIDVGQDHDYRFNLSALDGLAAGGATAFVAWGPQFLNFRRLELMGELKGRGFRMPPLICRGAWVSAGAVIGENCMVGTASVVSAAARLGFNTQLGAGCRVGLNAQLGSSVWMADGAQVGAGCRVGANSMLGSGTVLIEGVDMGRQCVLDVPGHRRTPLADKSFVTSAFPRGVVVLDHGG